MHALLSPKDLHKVHKYVNAELEKAVQPAKEAPNQRFVTSLMQLVQATYSRSTAAGANGADLAMCLSVVVAAVLFLALALKLQIKKITGAAAVAAAMDNQQQVAKAATRGKRDSRNQATSSRSVPNGSSRSSTSGHASSRGVTAGSGKAGDKAHVQRGGSPVSGGSSSSNGKVKLQQQHAHSSNAHSINGKAQSARAAQGSSIGEHVVLVACCHVKAAGQTTQCSELYTGGSTVTVLNMLKQ